MSLLKKLKLSPASNQAPKPEAAQSAAQGAKAGPAPKTEKFAQAAEAWLKTHRQAGERIADLKRTVKAHCADADPALVQEIEKGLAKLDQVFGPVDHRLADSLTNAAKAGDESAQKAELKKAKSILTEYINHVKTEPLVAHVDQNPFKVKTDLKALLAGGLSDAAKVIG